MTLPDERLRSVTYAQEFLYDLLDPKKTPRVPLSVRRRAGQVLRHYPHRFEMARVACGDKSGVFGPDPFAKAK